MSSIGDWLASIWESISSLPSKIAEFIINGIKNIFIPDTVDIKNKFNNMIHTVENSLGIVEDGFSDLKNSWTEKPATNIEENYKINGIGTLKLKFLDTKFLHDGVEFFRPIIRGFVVLLMFFFNYKMVLSFIGQDPGMYAHAKNDAEGGKQ